MKFRKKPVVIEAEHISVLCAMAGIGAALFNDLPKWVKDLYDSGDLIFIEDGVKVHTLEGWMFGHKTDWLICGVKGEVYPCKPEIFALTYERVEDV